MVKNFSLAKVQNLKSIDEDDELNSKVMLNSVNSNENSLDKNYDLMKKKFQDYDNSLDFNNSLDESNNSFVSKEKQLTDNSNTKPLVNIIKDTKEIKIEDNQG